MEKNLSSVKTNYLLKYGQVINFIFSNLTSLGSAFITSFMRIWVIYIYEF